MEAVINQISGLSDQIFFAFRWWHDSKIHQNVHVIRRIVRSPGLGKTESLDHALWAALVLTRRENRKAKG